MGSALELVEPPAEVRQAARQRFDAAQDMEQYRHDSSGLRNRIRKIKSAGGIARLPVRLKVQWHDEFEWFSQSMVGFRDWPLLLQIREIADHGASAGQAAHAAYAAAAAPLLEWWELTAPVTATKFGKRKPAAGEEVQSRRDGNSYAPSAAVRFLAEELSLIDPSLAAAQGDGTDAALDVAFRVCSNHVKSKTGGIPVSAI